ncbi:MAG: hypothetical protein OXG58_04765 [Gemmatimonadetes bacterium]|nr:hypothetical protein [Gemmatimonadota bacterium]MCY3944283.1 hypothetical protein [Gemmatimonadota bacterium]
MTFSETAQRAGVHGLLFASLLLLAFGCGDSTTEPENESLTMNEAVALFEGMRAIQQDSTPRILHASDDSTVVACPVAGQVRVTGSASEAVAGDTLRLSTDFTAAPAGCQFSQGGHQFTIDGDPGVRERTVVVIAGLFEHFSIEGTVTGSVDWQLDGRSGSCGGGRQPPGAHSAAPVQDQPGASAPPRWPRRMRAWPENRPLTSDVVACNPAHFCIS